MMRSLLTFATILALLGCPFRCALTELGGTVVSASQDSGFVQAAGCPCCRHRLHAETCETPVKGNENQPASNPARPAPEDCDCVCLCKGAIFEKQVDLPDWHQLDGFLPTLHFDDSLSAVPLLTNAADRDRWTIPSSPPSGRSIRFAVQSLLI